MENINDDVRIAIEKSLTVLKKAGYSDAEAVKLFLITLQFCNLQDQSTVAQAYLKMSVWFQDYYTVLTYKISENTISVQEKQDYQKLLHFENFLDVLNLWKKDYTILLRAFEASRKLYRLSTLGKIHLYKSMSKEDDAYLNQIAPIHKDDQKKYNQWVEPDLYIKSYQLQEKKVLKKNGNY